MCSSAFLILFNYLGILAKNSHQNNLFTSCRSTKKIFYKLFFRIKHSIFQFPILSKDLLIINRIIILYHFQTIYPTLFPFIWGHQQFLNKILVFLFSLINFHHRNLIYLYIIFLNVSIANQICLLLLFLIFIHFRTNHLYIHALIFKNKLILDILRCIQIIKLHSYGQDWMLSYRLNWIDFINIKFVLHHPNIWYFFQIIQFWFEFIQLTLKDFDYFLSLYQNLLNSIWQKLGFVFRANYSIPFAISCYYFFQWNFEFFS